MLYRNKYRSDLSKDESALLKLLRGRGFAVAIFGPAEVGHPLNRKTIEDRMLSAGRVVVKAIKEQT